MKQAVLNALHAIRELGTESQLMNADDAETMLNDVWSTKVGRTTYAAGLVD